MKFDDFQYLWPPRPEKKIPKNFLKFYEKQGWIAQVKRNGTCNVLYVSPKKEIICMNRHQDFHKQWAPTSLSSEPFKALPGKGWYAFVTEVLNNKVPGIRDTHYIFDVLVNDGEYLINTPLNERLQIVEDLFFTGNEKCKAGHIEITPNVWFAQTITGNFLDVWEKINERANETDGAPLDEGLVLKDPKSKLKICSKKASNAGWQVKCRVAHKNYSF